MIGITRRQFVRYSLLPGISPRARDIFASGFHYVPFFMALVYQAVRLLPPGHPYTKAANLGKFGIRHVIGEAANNLVFNWKTADQVALFFLLLFGVVIIFLEIVMLLVALTIGPLFAATAMPTNFADFFLTKNPKQDLAAMMFDLIFGIPGTDGAPSMFGSCFSVGGGSGCLDVNNNPVTDPNGSGILNGLGWPLPAHEGLHAMFFMYNTGMLVVAALILLYYVITILLETAQTGTPFGKRFNKVWAPVRIVMAFGLLMPFGMGAGGLNSAQYIVLYAAKFGSGFANNGWRIFNASIVDTYAGTKDNLVAQPQPPEIGGLLQFMFTAGTCWEIENLKGNDVRIYAVRDNVSAQPYLEVDNTTFYPQIAQFANGDKQILLRFGVQDDVKYAKFRGHVNPICGELVLPLSDPRVPNIATGVAADRAAVIMQSYYFDIIYEMWFSTLNAMRQDAGRNGALPGLVGDSLQQNYPLAFVKANISQLAGSPLLDPATCQCTILPDPSFKQKLQTFYTNDIIAALNNPSSTQLNSLDSGIGTDGAIKEAINSAQLNIQQNLVDDKGWAAAGLWYNKIAELNGNLISSAVNVPSPTRYPKVMEIVKAKKMQQDQNISAPTRFDPKLANGEAVKFETPEQAQEAGALWAAFNYWQTDNQSTTTYTAPQGSPILDFINQLFGTSGLFSMRKNVNVHPLAQLVGIGRSLIEAVGRNLMIAGGLAVGGAITGGLGSVLAGIGISFFMIMVSTAMTVGFLLYYVLPFLPFIYFFFAVGGWFKAIFEAMVGAPLWALAHIRIDGDGLAGQAAIGGYFLIFEIFLRPILIIFGLLASIQIFAAMVLVLNQTWDLVVANLGGFDVATENSAGAGVTSMLNYMRGPVDEFFFTLIYAIVVYIMALSSFKLIDQIPANILRWMGQSVNTFTDKQENAGEALSGTAAVGANQVLSSMSQSATGALKKIANRGG